MAKLRWDDKSRQKKDVLKDGEHYSEKMGVYYFYYYDENGKRKKIKSKELEGLRKKEKEIKNAELQEIKKSSFAYTLDHVYKEWESVKRGIKEHTRFTYTWTYEHYCMGKKIGKMKIKDITKVDIRKHYNALRDDYGLSVKTIESLQHVLSQIFKFAIDKNYILKNPCEGAMTELKREKEEERQAHEALTKEEQDRFLSFVKNHESYKRWYNIFMVFLGTGMRVSELTALREKDIDFDKGVIHITHALVYYTFDGKTQFKMNAPKSKAGKRDIIMLDEVREAILAQMEQNKREGLKCKSVIEGLGTEEDFYTDFIFLTKKGTCYHNVTLNRHLKHIIRDANWEAEDYGGLILPNFSCHSFRSTFITRCAENYVPIDIVMKQVGHSDREITEKIYTTVHPEWQKDELQKIKDMFKMEQDSKDSKRDSKTVA